MGRIKDLVKIMPSCPDCHIYKGLWSELNEKEGEWKCSINSAHVYSRDGKGYFHKK